MQWIVTDGFKKKLPKWGRSAALDDDGTVFLPAAVAGNETQVLLCVSFDGNVPVIHASGHLYIPTWWIKREHPELCEEIERIEKKIRGVV